MPTELIIAHFRDYDRARQAAAELEAAGIAANDLDLRASAEGPATLAVRAEAGGAIARKAREILANHATAPLETRPADPPAPGATTLTGAPADEGVSPGTLPHAERGEWLVRKEGELAREFDPDPEPNQP